MLQSCPFKGPRLFCSQNMTGDIYCVYFYVGGMFACFALKQKKIQVKILDIYC